MAKSAHSPRPRMVAATIGDRTATFLPAHRDGTDTPAALTLNVALPVSHDDLAAALWLLVCNYGLTLAELDDDANAHMVIVDTLVGESATNVESARFAADALTAGTDDHQLYTAVRARVDALYGPAPQPARRRASRQLAAVGCGRGPVAGQPAMVTR